MTHSRPPLPWRRTFPSLQPVTTITYNIPAGTADLPRVKVNLAVYDLLGRVMRVLVDEVQGTGEHAVRFEAGGIASGVYVYRLAVNGMATARTMLLLR